VNLEIIVKKEVNKLINKKDHLLVALSGGKDSTTILYLLNKWGYMVEAVIIDLGFNKEDVSNARSFCKEQGIKLHEVNYDMKSLWHKNKGLNYCQTCGVMRRWLLNRKAKELKVTKIVTGHNQDDLVESVLMNLMMGNPSLCKGLTSQGKKNAFVQRVKPMNYVPEELIKEYAKKKGFKVSYAPCPYSSDAFRRYVKNAFKDENKDNIVKYYKKLALIIKKKYKSEGTLKPCKVCGEASRSGLCKACSLQS
jgi:uncharacterized protein (TIGR00269 family)